MFQLCLRFEKLFSIENKKNYFSFLAQQIWDLAQDKKNPSDFAMAIDESEIGAFTFTDEFIFDLWAAIDDIKNGRIKEKETEDERL
jgi:hypothetical protein